MKPACERKESLFKAWQEATAIHTRAIGELMSEIGHVSEVEYETIRAKAETARNLARRLRAELDEHIAAHGC